MNDNEINEALAESLQKAFDAHKVDPTNLSLTEEFLACCLGAMYGSRPASARGKMMEVLPAMIDDGIEAGVPEPGTYNS